MSQVFLTPQPLSASLGLSREDVAALVRFAERDARRGRLEDAVETLRVAAVLDPRSVVTWSALASCYAKLGDTSRAASASRVAAKVKEVLGGVR